MIFLYSFNIYIPFFHFVLHHSHHLVLNHSCYIGTQLLSVNGNFIIHEESCFFIRCAAKWPISFNLTKLHVTTSLHHPSTIIFISRWSSNFDSRDVCYLFRRCLIANSKWKYLNIRRKFDKFIFDVIYHNIKRNIFTIKRVKNCCCLI